MNKLYFGTNLRILREYVLDASVDLIYLDPPFNSSATYNLLFKEKSGEESAVSERSLLAGPKGRGNALAKKTDMCRLPLLR